MQNYNLIISVEEVEQSGEITEPVTLQEAKDYMRIEGFQDVDESDSTDFDDDDTLIETLITSCRQRLERMYSISIVPKTLRAVITNQAGGLEIPYGPVIEVDSLKDEDDNTITEDNYKLVGGLYKSLHTPLYDNMVIEYQAGYEVCPEALKIEILRMTCYLYENRGDKEFKDYVFTTGSYNRTSFIV